jgi:hypothetical protein
VDAHGEFTGLWIVVGRGFAPGSPVSITCKIGHRMVMVKGYGANGEALLTGLKLAYELQEIARVGP